MSGTVTFYLRPPKKIDQDKKEPSPAESKESTDPENDTVINLRYRFDRKTSVTISTGERISRKYWNKVKGRAKVTKDNPDGSNINTRLDTLRIAVLNAVRDFQNSLHPGSRFDWNALKQALTNTVRRKPEPEPVTLLQAIQEYIDTTNKAPRTKLGYGTTLNVLKEYEPYYKKTFKTPLSFESINMDFYEHFVNYLIKEKLAAKNTIGSHIKQVKVFMDYCNTKGYTTNQGHRHRKFIKMEEEAETIYLNDKELDAIYKKDLSKNPKLDRVRDLFLIGCYTGLRFSDLSQLTPANFTDNGTRLKIKTQKTGETVVIPCHYRVVEILRKYDNKLPRVMSNQKFNDYLKEIGEAAKLNEQVNVSITKGGLKVDSNPEKYKLITVHTARRSFATNMYLAGVPTISIMKIIGHRTERAFMKYIKVTQEQNADILANHPYFIKPLKVSKTPRKRAANQ